MANKQLIFEVLALAKAEGFDAAARKVERLGRSSDDITRSFDRQTKSVDRQTKSLHLMSTGIVALGAATVPVAGVAAGAVIGLGAAAGVAVTGILGIRDAMKQGTPLGEKYRRTFAPLVNEFDQLKKISAAGMFKGINSGVKALQPLFPVINKDVRLFSAQMGQIAGHLGPAIATLFTRVNPLFATFGDQLVNGSKSFEDWAKSSDAVSNFVAYVQTNLPNVEHTIGALVTTASHIVMGFEPFGSTVLTSIRLFSQAINAIPVGVLQTILPLLGGLKLGNTLANTFNNAAVGLGKLASNIGSAGKVATGSSGFFGKLGKVVGGLGPVGIAAGVALGGLSVALGHGNKETIERTKRVNDLTEAIKNGTLATAIWANAQETGAAGATKIGLSQKQIVTALTGTSAQYDAAQKRLSDYEAREDSAAAAGGRFGASSQEVAQRTQQVHAEVAKLKGSLAESRAEYEQAKQEVEKYAKTIDDAALAQQVADGSFKTAAKSLGLTADQYINAKLAVDQNKQSVEQATAAMVLQNDAAGLLSQTLNKLGGNNLGVAQSQTAVASATNAAAQSFKENGNAISGNSAKAIANQQALQSAASAALQHRDAVAKQTGSTVKATEAFRKDKAALLDQLRAQGRLTPAVQRYINTLFKVPPVRRTKMDVAATTAYHKLTTIIGLGNVAAKTRRMIVGADTSSAYTKLQRLNSYLQNMLHPVITASVRYTLPSGAVAGFGRNIQASTGGLIWGGRVQRLAAGGPAGLVVGPGTGTSDTAGLFALSNGEFVSNAEATRRNKQALIAANHGATLSVLNGRGQIRPMRQPGGRGGGGAPVVVNHFTLNVPGLVGGQDAARQIVAALEQWPGQINIGRKVRN